MNKENIVLSFIIIVILIIIITKIKQDFLSKSATDNPINSRIVTTTNDYNSEISEYKLYDSSTNEVLITVYDDSMLRLYINDSEALGE